MAEVWYTIEAAPLHRFNGIHPERPERVRAVEKHLIRKLQLGDVPQVRCVRCRGCMAMHLLPDGGRGALSLEPGLPPCPPVPPPAAAPAPLQARQLFTFPIITEEQLLAVHSREYVEDLRASLAQVP